MDLQVIYGFYPDVRPEKKGGYDFIIFNDVFEHILDCVNIKERVMADRGVSRTMVRAIASLLKLFKPFIDASEADIRIFLFKQK